MAANVASAGGGGEAQRGVKWKDKPPHRGAVPTGLKLHTCEKRRSSLGFGGDFGLQRNLGDFGLQTGLTRRSTSLVAARSDSTARLMALTIRGKELAWRERLFLILEEPTSSVPAKVVSIVLRLALIASATVAAVESVDSVTDSTGSWPWVATSIACNALFVVEAIARVTCYVPFRDFVRDPFIWLDVLTVVPFLWALATYLPRQGTAPEKAQRVIEAFAQLRLIKLCRYYEGVRPPDLNPHPCLCRALDL